MTADPNTAQIAHAAQTADDDAAAVLVVLAALAARTGTPTVPAPRSVWNRQDRRRTPGPDAWWASGLPR